MVSLAIYLIANFGLAMAGCFVALYLPGSLVVRRVLPRIEPLPAFLIAVVTGMALFGAQGYVFGWLQLRSLTYLYLLIVFVLSLFERKQIFFELRATGKAISALPKMLLLLVLCGVILQSIQMIGNGLPLATGMSFWRTNAYDGIFHIGLIESIVRRFPPQEPSSSGLAVVNYHYWSDLILAELVRIFQVSPVFLFFQWMPLFLSMVTSLSVVVFVRELTRNAGHVFQNRAILLSLGFVLLGADAGWIFPLLIHHVLSFAYPAIDNGATQFLNMPHVFGKLFFYAIGTLFLHWRRERRNTVLFLLIFLSAITFGLKIYFGMALAIGLLCVFVVDGIIARFALTKLVPQLCAGIVFVGLFALIYLPVNHGAGGLSWYPLEWPKLLINVNNFDWRDLEYRIAIVHLVHQNAKIVLYNAVLVTVGLVAIHGTRLFGFVLSKKTTSIFGRDGLLFFYIPVLICTILGFTTLQVTGSFNVFNFFAVSFCILAVSLALIVAQVWQRSVWLGTLILIFVIGLSLPRDIFETVTMVSHYHNGEDSVSLSPRYLDGLAYLRAHAADSSVIATSLEDPLESKSTFITAFTGKQTYLAGTYILETHNQPFQDKQAKLRMLFANATLENFAATARGLGITYVLVDHHVLNTPGDVMLATNANKAVFANEDVLLYDIHTL